MSVPRSVAEVLAEHVTLEVEGIDRMYLNVYVPGLQRRARSGQLLPISSRPPVRLQRVDGSDQQSIHGGAWSSLPGKRKFPLIPFRKGQRKDDVAAEQRKKFTEDGRRGVHRQGAGEDAGVPHRAATQ